MATLKGPDASMDPFFFIPLLTVCSRGAIIPAPELLAPGTGARQC